jgi:hypothetical protein
VENIKPLADEAHSVLPAEYTITPHYRGHAEITDASDLPPAAHLDEPRAVAFDDYSGQAEIAVPNSTDDQAAAPPSLERTIEEFSTRWAQGRNVLETLEVAIKKCDAARESAPAKLFARMSEQAVKEMNPAYPVHLSLLAGGEEAMKLARKHPVFAARSRAFMRGTEATVAAKIMLTPGPDDEKACSDYAGLLIWAAAHAVEPEQFISAMSEVPFKAVRDFAKRARGRKKKGGKQSQNPSLMDASNTETEAAPTHPMLEVAITVFDGSGIPTSHSWSLDEKKVAALTASLRTGPTTSAGAERLLDLLLDIISPPRDPVTEAAR